MRIVFFLVIGALGFMSCYTPRYMYSPAAQNIPVLVKKGDSKVAAYISSNLSQKNNANNRTNESRSRGFDLQGAYAISNNFAIQANYFKRTESNNGYTVNGNLDSSFIRYKRQLTEIGVGYFKSLNKNNRVILQVFGGAGRGKFRFTDNGKTSDGINYNRTHLADITKLYIQPAFMFRSKGSFAASLSTRFSFVKFGNIKTNYTQGELSSYNLDDLTHGFRTFFEPAFSSTFGFNKLPGLQFEFQLGLALLTSSRYVDHRSFNFSGGIVLDIPKIFGNQ
jgi:hypothetical protein